MSFLQNPEMFPLAVLPTTLRQAVVEVQSFTMAPCSLVVNSALGVLSIACQDTFDVELPFGAVVPVGIFLLTIAESGERKTSVDRLFTRSIETFEKKVRQLADQAESVYQTEKATWNFEFESIKRRLGKSISTDTSCLTAEVENLMKRKPTRQKYPVLIAKDITPAALVTRLHSTWPSAALVSSEAGALLNGHTSSQLPMLNSLWDGDSLSFDRKTEGCLFLENARLTISLMIQPKTFDGFQSGRGKLARDNGFFSRFLIVSPFSTQGTRIANSTNTPRLDALQKFETRIADLLDGLLTRDIKNERSVLNFSAESKVYFCDYQNHLESRIAEGGPYFQIRDAASKAGQQAARLAALFHAFEGAQGEIQLSTTQAAINVSDWYLEQFSKRFNVQNQIPQNLADALLLDSWFRERHQKGMPTTLKKNQIRQLCPNSIRDSARLEKALELLSFENIVRQLCASNSRALWWHSPKPLDIFHSAV